MLKVKGLNCCQRDAKISCYETVRDKSMKSEECRSSRVATIYCEHIFISLTIAQISIARAPSQHFASFYVQDLRVENRRRVYLNDNLDTFGG